MKKKNWLVPVLLVMALPAQADIYKCVVDGKTTFQDWPCGEEQSQRRMESSVSTMGSPPTSRRFHLADDYQERLEKEQLEAALAREKARVRKLREDAEDARYETARKEGRVIDGMTESDARLIYGRPTKTRRDGICKVLTWYRPYHWVRICRNKVVSSHY